MVIKVLEQHAIRKYQNNKKKEQALGVRLATNQEEIQAAQRLRYKVFSQEYGANFEANIPGIDQNKYDQWCDHLIVVDRLNGRTVGTYRVLRPANAELAGSFYSESEFDLSSLAPIRHQMVEFGRACIDPHYRNGATLMMLWTGLSEIIRQYQYQYVLGCASVSLRDDGVTAAEVWRSVRDLINKSVPYQVEAGREAVNNSV